MARSGKTELSNRKFVVLAALAVIVLGFVAYLNTFDGEFVWDDASSILLHQHVRAPGAIFSLFTEDQHAFAGGQGNFYRPLLSVSFMFDYFVSTFGEAERDPASVPMDLGTYFFHLSSTLWHIAAALCLLALMHRLGAPRPVLAFVPLLYVVHPLHTEAVAYISGRADSMSATFMFAGLYFATWTETARRRHAGLALVLLCFACGLLSKESALIFPALLALGLLLAFPRPDAAPRLTRWLALAASLIVLGIYAALRTTVLNFGSDSTPPDTSFFERIEQTFQAFALYFGLIFAPVGLHMERSLDGVAPYAAAIGFALFLSCLLFIAFSWRKGLGRAAFGMAWFLAAWLPISGIFPLNAPMAEHWLYVPLAGLLWALAEAICAVTTSVKKERGRQIVRYATGALAVVCIGVLLGLTTARNLDWHDNESIYSATLRDSPESPRVHFNLAVTYDDLLDNPYGARRHYEAVTRIYEERKRNDPASKDLFWNEELESYLSLGNFYLDEGRIPEAFTHYVKVLSTESNDSNVALRASASYGMGRCFLATGDRERAVQSFESALRALPYLQPEVDALLSRQSPLG